ncbi:hypothetical protein DTO166G4_5441 [Paecilomyces variotii]|nr:hypothetical protein DTO032I3_5053 [Paecilomyces variotii]KAJ9212937.1 hypothetical protein DTO166G4_5441 [Paecilomyces variotii]KAJ9236144.1 hypothetical protein DTO166G5_4189 [Paecilomyces variotii]KAJ9254145.1 hypothetical protein DTO207G8_3722 [Paecilomyces variotii]KAJ9277249.1 hypothetical protein DTO021D3_5936 [Paecilomyces variotii]
MYNDWSVYAPKFGSQERAQVTLRPVGIPVTILLAAGLSGHTWTFDRRTNRDIHVVKGVTNNENCSP